MPIANGGGIKTEPDGSSVFSVLARGVLSHVKPARTTQEGVENGQTQGFDWRTSPACAPFGVARTDGHFRRLRRLGRTVQGRLGMLRGTILRFQTIPGRNGLCLALLELNLKLTDSDITEIPLRRELLSGLLEQRVPEPVAAADPGVRCRVRARSSPQHRLSLGGLVSTRARLRFTGCFHRGTKGVADRGFFR